MSVLNRPIFNVAVGTDHSIGPSIDISITTSIDKDYITLTRSAMRMYFDSMERVMILAEKAQSPSNSADMMDG